MNWNERMELSQKRMEDIKKKMAASAESSKKARALKKEEIKSDMADVNASIEKFADRVEKVVNDGLTESAEAIEDFADIVEVKVNDGLAKSGAAVEDFADDVEAEVNDSIATVQGDVNAAKENARLSKEERDSKLNTIRLKTQMNMEEKKKRITEKKEAMDKASQEKRINELLDYAESCQALTLAMALETEAAFLDAADEIADYVEKYGQPEDNK